jgi:hypothetical protein
MKKLLFVIALLLLTGICYAADGIFEVKTGYGYFKDAQGNIIAKAELPKGKHPITEGYTYVEVSSPGALENVKIYEPPKLPDELKEEAIQKEQAEILRKQAIDNLKTKKILNENEEYIGK